MNKYLEAYQNLTTRIYKNDHIEDVYKDLEVLGELVDKATHLMEDISKCPSCNSFVTSVDIYCPNCGQKLDWAKKRLPNSRCFNNAELCKYYPLREFLERIEYERSE